MKCALLILIVISILLCAPRNTWAEIKINEIYPAPATGDAEWVELYNDSDLEVLLSSYRLQDADNNSIVLPQSMQARSFTIASSSAVLNNTGDTVVLKLNNTVIEQITYTGTFNSSKSYSRCPDGLTTWLVSSIQTKGISNNSICPTSPTPSPTTLPTLIPTEIPLFTLSPTATPLPTQTPTPTTPIATPTQSQSFENNIYLSEVMVNPNTSEHEWIEIFNNNDFDITLRDWYFDDENDEGSSPKVFTLFIPTKEYGILELATSIFNNDEDSVRLLNTEKEVIDAFHYKGSIKGKSWAKHEEKFCAQEPTKFIGNNNCIDTKTITQENNTPQDFIEPIYDLSTPSDYRETTKTTNIKIDAPLSSSQVLGEQTTNTDFTEKEQVFIPLNTSEQNTLPDLSLGSSSFSLLSAVSLIVKILLKTRPA